MGKGLMNPNVEFNTTTDLITPVRMFKLDSVTPDPDRGFRISISRQKENRTF
jgi:hypothetical protein